MKKHITALTKSTFPELPITKQKDNNSQCCSNKLKLGSFYHSQPKQLFHSTGIKKLDFLNESPYWWIGPMVLRFWCLTSSLKLPDLLPETSCSTGLSDNQFKYPLYQQTKINSKSAFNLIPIFFVDCGTSSDINCCLDFIHAA